MPKADFSVSNVCLGNAASFVNSSTIAHGSLTYQWDFRDTNTSSATNPSHTYSSSGTYGVRLTARSEHTCSNTIERDISVSNPSVGGSVTGSATVCSGGNSGSLNLTGHTGSVVRWESSLNGEAPWTAVTHTGGSLNYQNLTATTHYRAVVRNGACSAVNSAIASITVDTPTQGGEVLGSTTVCVNTNSGSLNLKNHLGNVVRWESSTNGGGTWSHILQTATELTYSNLPRTTHYRALVRNGSVCESRYSSIAVVTTSPVTVSGTLTGTTTVCSGSSNAGTVALSGHTGNVIRWESSPTGAEPWTSINHTQTSLEYSHLVSTTYYRAIVQSQACNPLPSNVVPITVNPRTVRGVLSGAASVCSGQNNGQITLSDHTGSVLRWQFSENGLTWNDVTNTTDRLTYNNLEVTRQYRVQVRSGVCDALFTDPVTITVNPFAVVDFTVGNICVGAPVTFSNTSTVSTGTIAFYDWDFEDGKGSVVRSPEHTFLAPRTYNVRLTTTTDRGCVRSATRPVVANPVPNVNFSLNDVCLNNDVEFTNLSSISSGSITSYLWQFGEGGATSTAQHPSPRIYENPGTYTVTLRGTSGQNCSATVSKPVTIFPRAEVDFTFDNVCKGEKVDFINQTKLASGNMTYRWRFGDGVTTPETNPSHLYANPGAYTVILEVLTEKQCADEISRQVTVYPQPQASFEVDDICLVDQASFTNTSTVLPSVPLLHSWDFGDGNSDNVASPEHPYFHPGTYLVRLTTRTNDGCSSSFSRNIKVYPMPVANFTVDDVCLGSPASFSNFSTITSGVLSYQWEFGEGGLSTEVSPEHLYINDNVYDVQLTARSAMGCSNSITKKITVFPETEGGEVLGGTTICAGSSGGTLDLSQSVGDIIRWESSLTGGQPWTSIANTTTSLAYENLSATTSYRAVVKSGVCGTENAVVAVVNVDQPTLKGTLVGATEVCDDANEGKLNLENYRGGVVKWAYSNDQGTTWNDIFHSSDELSYEDLEQTTWYKTFVQNGVCSLEETNVVAIKVSPETIAGTLSGEASVCKGINGGTIELDGQVGAVVRWESSPTGSAPWTTIQHTAPNLTYSNLLNSTYYRAVVKSGVCGSKNTDLLAVLVSPNTERGTILGSAEVCYQINSGNLDLTGYVGNVLKWQSSLNGSTWTDIEDSEHPRFTFNDLTSTTFYRAQVQSGVCPAEFSAPALVTVNPLPVVNFSTQEVCQGEATRFRNGSSIGQGSIFTFEWDFGNGSGSNSRNPVYTYPRAGTYEARLIAISNKGCIDSIHHEVRVNYLPEVNFTQTDICLNASMQFHNLSQVSEADIQEFQWTFGDEDASSNERSPSYLYPSPGTYQVELRVVSEKSCTASFAKSVQVFPRANVDFSVDNVCFGNAVNLRNNTIISSGNLTYLWRFGDGNTATQINPSHLYDEDGSYLIRLEATTNNGCMDHVVKEVIIYPQPEASFNVEDVCLSKATTFHNTTTVSGGQLNFFWNFGDGAVSSEPNPVHIYESSGTYLTTLLVTTPQNCRSEFSRNLRINPIPTANFVFNDVCDGNRMTFSNMSSIAVGNIDYTWEFGDGNSSHVVNPAHLYGQHGIYKVTLTASSGYGCFDVMTKDVEVFPQPKADFQAANVCDGFPVTFNNTSTIAKGGISSFIWEFGDGSTAIVQHPVKQFDKPGTYEVSLAILSDKGCPDQVMKNIVVNSPPVANFVVDNKCLGESIQAKNKSTFSGGALIYDWSFGDGNTSIVTSPSHKYKFPGIYPIKLIATTSFGCQDSITRFVEIYPLPQVTTSADTSVSKGFTVGLLATGGTHFSWYPVSGLSNSNIANPIARPLETTTYNVVVSSEYGCKGYGDVTVEVIEDYKLIATNILTPDGNGQNDTWIVHNIETFGNCNVEVFNRWGKLVYEKKGYQNDWAGTHGYDILPDGTYYYIITFDSSDRVYKGALTILRNK
jgi:gliding motility-associated-like protein